MLPPILLFSANLPAAALYHVPPAVHASAPVRPKPKVVLKARPRRPGTFRFYDSANGPSAIPEGSRMAIYANGAYAASPRPGDFNGHGNPLWIDVVGNNPNANAVDSEPGDASPLAAAGWAKQRLRIHPNEQAIIYTMKSWWGEAKASVNKCVPPQKRGHVKWWIADPTGRKHIVPGSDATQWAWGKSVDTNEAIDGFGSR